MPLDMQQQLGTHLSILRLLRTNNFSEWYPIQITASCSEFDKTLHAASGYAHIVKSFSATDFVWSYIPFINNKTFSDDFFTFPGKMSGNNQQILMSIHMR